VSGSLVLACDACASTASLALVDGDVLLAETTFRHGLGHSRRLVADAVALVERCEHRMADLDRLAVTLGPGSFTGVRIALAGMKALAFALDRPLYGVPTLKALAWPMLPRGLPVLAALDARRGEVYAALFDDSGAPRVESMAVDPTAFARLAAEAVPDGQIVAVGEGFTAYPEAFREGLGDRLMAGSGADHVVRASAVAWLAIRPESSPLDVAVVEPIYLRRSEAEVKRDARIS
jgi:tRNA threonylcarbamoyladenosine biosynthesis protein TsaB